MILGQNWFFVENLRQFFCHIRNVQKKIMIWANVTKFGQNFIAPQVFLAGTPMVWHKYSPEVLEASSPCLSVLRFFVFLRLFFIVFKVQ